MMGCSTVTDVRVEASAPIRIDIMTSPINVHMIPKIRAGIERGDRSPYLKQTRKNINISKKDGRSISQDNWACYLIYHELYL